MSDSIERVTDAELAVLKLLWEAAPQTARALTERLYPRCAPSDVGTVQKLLQRLEAKGLVTRDRSSHAHEFSAAISQATLAGRQLEGLADRLADGSLTPFLLHLIQSKRLNKRERDALKKLFDAEA